MEVIIYSFFIVTGIAGLSYFTIKKRYARLLEVEQGKTYSLRNNEIQLSSEKQRLDAALKEKERQIAEIKSSIASEESKATTLSSEVLTKDKQIQSLTAQLQHEASQRTMLEHERSTIERQLSEFRSKASEEEQKASSLHSDVTTKEQTIHSLSDELQQERELKEKIEFELLEKERAKAHLESRIAETENRQSALINEHTAKEQHLQSTLDQQTAELQHLREKLQQEITARTSLESESQERIRSLQQTIEELRPELDTLNSSNESMQSSRESMLGEFRSKEQHFLNQLSDAQLSLTVTKQELEKTTEMLREQSRIREATEYALQESKQKLYALISEREQKIKDQVNAISALQTELAVKSNDLISAEQSIHNMLRHIPIPVFVVNEHGICEYCNTALEELVGYGMNELSEKHFARLFPEDERTFYEEQWGNTENRAEQFQGETRIIAATNDMISAAVNFVDIQPNSETKKYVGFIIDRTTEKDSQKHHAAAKQREQELLDLKSRFIGMVSNQLRTSLVTIASNTELLERFFDKWSAERRYHSFLRINESIRQMIDLVRDVTFTTRASTETYALSISDINLESLLQSTATDLMNDFESHHHFILSEQGKISSVALDEILIRTIITQLLSNAFKYSRDHSDVRVHIEQKPTACVLSITDQGIGIPAAEQKHLFSSFFRASNVSNIYGTGLGLTIVQQCVQMHGGSIAIESELNKGTKVTVTIPVSSSQ